MKISAVIITLNEEKNISPAIESVSWADEVIVVDSESTDRTCEIAENAGAKVITSAWEGFASQKQFAADSASNDWIFSLDADERATPDLALEIQELKTKSNLADGYKIPRLSIYMGRPIKHGGWYPDRQLRLFDRRKGRWSDVLIHESFKLNEGSRMGELNGDILHYSVEDAAHHHRMIGERYAPLASRQMFEQGRRTSLLGIIAAGPSAFARAYFLKLGLLDGSTLR